MDNIEWTSKNVKNLGVYFGNDNPAFHTFNSIMPGVNRRLNYWKQFHLSIIGKARAIEIFIASKLVYAIKFYKIPKEVESKFRSDIFDYINYLKKVKTIAQKEMWRPKDQGGIKLVNIQIKSEISKVKWLMEIASDPICKIHLHIFENLLGVQKGNISGRDIIFLEKSYIQKHLKTNSEFYKEALSAISVLNTNKAVRNVDQWHTEHLFL